MRHSQLTFAAEDSANQRFFTDLIFEVAQAKIVLLNKHARNAGACADFILTCIKFGQLRIFIFIVSNARAKQVNQRIIRLMFNQIFDQFQCFLIILALAAASQQRHRFSELI